MGRTGWVAVGVATLAAVTAACGSGGGGGLAGRARQAADVRAAQARRAADQAGLPAGVQDFVALAAAVGGHRFTVSYDLGGTPPQTGTLVQRPPFRRFDVVDPGPAGSASAQAVVDNADGGFVCRRASGQWTCRRDAGAVPTLGPFSLDDLSSTVDTLSKSKETYDFRLDHRRIAGVRALCLVTTRKPTLPPDPSAVPRAELCLSPEGAPLLVESGTGPSVQATHYSTSAASGSFTLPAPAG